MPSVIPEEHESYREDRLVLDRPVSNVHAHLGDVGGHRLHADQRIPRRLRGGSRREGDGHGLANGA